MTTGRINQVAMVAKPFHLINHKWALKPLSSQIVQALSLITYTHYPALN